jgi:hypothetical protein
VSDTAVQIKNGRMKIQFLRIKRIKMESANVSDNSKRTAIIGLMLMLWALAMITLSVTYVPDLYWYSYYSVDYTLGFVRRGLAGELLGLFPRNQYFIGLSVLRWLSTIILAIALVVLARTVALRSGRSERRLMLALLTPLLPCGFTYGLFSARPDLIGATALICFAIALKSAGSERTIIIASAVFGGATAIFTLAHEAIPFLFGLGVLAAMAVLAHERSEKTLHLSAALAIVPGLLTAFAIALLGKRGISKQLCELVPRGPVNHPLAGDPSFGELLVGFRFESDYHDWMCRCIAPFFDQTIFDATNFVASIGVIALLGSSALGIALLTLTITAVSHISGVPFSRMLSLLSKRPAWVLFGFALFLPIFAMGADWTRWWVMITFDIAIVFVLFASGEKESARPLTLRTQDVCIFAAAVLAGPLGSIPGFGFPVELLI